MSFLAPKIQSPETGMQRQSYDASGPVPVVFGRARIPLKLIESPFNHIEMHHGDRRPKGHRYSLVLAGCHGTVDWMRLWIHGRALWGTETHRDGAIYSDIVNGDGPGHSGEPVRMRVYWGTPDQAADPFLNGSTVHGMEPPRNPDGSSRIHPTYSGIFYVIFYSLHLDDPLPTVQGNTTIPVVEAEVFVRPPGDPGDVRMDTGSNPVAIAREILRNPVWGADLSPAIVPDSNWTTAAAALHQSGYHTFSGQAGENPGGDGNLSPVLSQERDLADHLAELFGYYDGYVRLSQGQLLPGWFTNRLEDPGEVTTLSRHDCVGEPDVDPEGWEDTISELTVTHTNAFESWGESTITARSTYNRQVTGRAARKSTNLPWVINPWHVRPHAARLLHQQAIPGLRARLKVLRHKARNPDGSLLLPGDVATLNLEPYALNLLCRVVEREDRGSDVLLSLINERGRWPEEYLPALDERQLPEIAAPGTIDTWRLFELPDQLVSAPWPPPVAILARRPHYGVVTAIPWICPDDQFDGAEQALDGLALFPAHGVLSGPLAAADPEVAITLDPADLPGELDRDYTAAEQSDGYLLVLVGDELMSLGLIASAPTPSTRTYAVERGMFGTPVQDHSAGADAWIIRREDLIQLAYRHELMRWSAPYNPAEATVWFRLVAVTGWAAGPANTPVSLTLRQRVPTLSHLWLDSGTTHLIQYADGSIRPRVSVSWPEVMDPTILAGGQIDLQWRLSTDPADQWRDLASMGARSLFTYLHEASEGQSVIARARLVTSYGLRGAWTEASGGYHVVVGETANPGNVIIIEGIGHGVTFDSTRHENTLVWANPADIDLAEIVIDLSIAGGPFVELARLPKGTTRYVDKYVAGIGGTQQYIYRWRTVDRGGRQSDAPWPQKSVDVPELPDGGALDGVPVVTAASVVARTAGQVGPRFYAQWTGDGAFLDLIRIVYYPTANPEDTRVIERPIGTSGTITQELPVAADRYADGTQFSFLLQRGQTAQGTFTVWSHRTSLTANLALRATPPLAVSSASAVYEAALGAWRVRIQYDEPDGVDYSHAEIWAEDTIGGVTGDPYLVGRRYRSEMKLLAGNPAERARAFFIHEDVYPREVARSIVYSIHSVDYQGNRTASPVTLDPVAINPLAFSIGTYNIYDDAAPRALLLEWAARGSDKLDIYVWKTTDPSQNIYVQAELDAGGAYVDEIPWTGGTKVQMHRGYRINGRVVYSAPSGEYTASLEEYNIASIQFPIRHINDHWEVEFTAAYAASKVYLVLAPDGAGVPFEVQAPGNAATRKIRYRDFLYAQAKIYAFQDYRGVQLPVYGSDSDPVEVNKYAVRGMRNVAIDRPADVDFIDVDVDVGNNVIYVGTNTLQNGDAVIYSAGGNAALSPLIDKATYYVRDRSSSTIKLAAAPGGGAIDLAGSISGTHSLLAACGVISWDLVDDYLQAPPNEDRVKVRVFQTNVGWDDANALDLTLSAGATSVRANFHSNAENDNSVRVWGERDIDTQDHTPEFVIGSVVARATALKIFQDLSSPGGPGNDDAV